MIQPEDGNTKEDHPDDEAYQLIKKRSLCSINIHNKLLKSFEIYHAIQGM